MKRMFWLSLIILALAGCMTARMYFSSTSILHPGMTADEVIQVAGHPEKIRRTVTTEHWYEQWVYRVFLNRIVLLRFVDGALESWVE